ncbi:helix-turn-helix domain-containing protein [Bacillaceae bacterium S4-13-58]
MSSKYLASFTKNKNLLNFLNLLFRNKYNLEFKKVVNYEKAIILNSNCIGILVDFDSYDITSNLHKQFNEFVKPIIIFPNKLKKTSDFILWQDNLKKFLDPISDIASNNFYNLDGIYLCDDIYFSIENHCIYRERIPLTVTNLEFRLLYILIKNKNLYINTDLLIEKLDLMTPSSLYVCVRKIRDKIESNPSNPRVLVYQRNKGYCLKINTLNKN